MVAQAIQDQHLRGRHRGVRALGRVARHALDHGPEEVHALGLGAVRGRLLHALVEGLELHPAASTLEEPAERARLHALAGFASNFASNETNATDTNKTNATDSRSADDDEQETAVNTSNGKAISDARASFLQLPLSGKHQQGPHA